MDFAVVISFGIIIGLLINILLNLYIIEQKIDNITDIIENGEEDEDISM